jgi:hypothetical protein
MQMLEIVELVTVQLEGMVMLGLMGPAPAPFKSKIKNKVPLRIAQEKIKAGTTTVPAPLFSFATSCAGMFPRLYRNSRRYYENVGKNRSCCHHD